MIRIAIVDDHPIIRRGVRQIIDMEEDLAVTVEASNPSDLLLALGTQPCDVLLLDISLGERNGLEIMADIRILQPKIQVIALSVYPPAQFAAAAFRAGASAYLTKESAPEELVKAIRTVRAGRRYVNSAAGDALAEAIHAGQPDPLQLLSPRELEVLRLYCSGRTVTEISNDTGLNVRTVSTYKSRILGKLKLSTNADLIAYAVRHNLIGGSKSAAG